jgi:hypothetical protein
MATLLASISILVGVFLEIAQRRSDVLQCGREGRLARKAVFDARDDEAFGCELGEREREIR